MNLKKLKVKKEIRAEINSKWNKESKPVPENIFKNRQASTKVNQGKQT